MATAIDLDRTRGDTQRIILRITDSTGAPVDISLWTAFKLTVDQSRAPVDGTTKVEEMIGTITSGGLDGRVHFIPTGTIAAGRYFYDAQALDSNAEKFTFAAGRYTVIQDITKA